jgi:hypothetical protein
MRAVTTFVTGVFFVAGVVFVAGATVNPLMDVIVQRDAAQALGWVQHAKEIRTVMLKWAPLGGLFFFIVWPFLWAIRREKRTSSAFRRKP